MTTLAEQLPHVAAFPHALGTGLLIHTEHPLSEAARGRIGSFIERYESVLSRFREDSTVARMRAARHGGTFVFPDWCADLFDLHDRLFTATGGAIDPCVGEDLIRLGYDASYSFVVSPDAFGYDSSDDAFVRSDTLDTAAAQHFGDAIRTKAEREWHLGAIHGRAAWVNDVTRNGATLVTHRAVALDFGSCGKGYLVDMIAGLLADDIDRVDEANRSQPTSMAAHDHPDSEISPALERRQTAATPGAGQCSNPNYVIDAGGDLLVNIAEPLTIALEDPSDASRAVGTAELRHSAFCASAPSRRHWGEAAGHQLHHLLNAIDGLPVDDVAATWVAVSAASSAYPTAVADGLATALFTTPASRLSHCFDFNCAILNADRTATQSEGFPGNVFTR
ncbi:FAD:protein FMN transferase [Bifidobacterium olomucense]|uniref:FAD:protein FMN transferase n=1 Tax=Bifidobacterium olomucense TaxID=2675324 RepID=A0A7Y0EXV1_9BIFI|nr:FAD:protein FMN transferase [Bifidobacterium sp. DSM 109959]NMM98405.1 thiamine biosynthesis protein ApbE [Bifidobacterium sp. DSM 109959]